MTAKPMATLALGLLSGPCLTGGASAEVCVGAAFETPFPGATGVETRRADVPSPRFPGLWQEGRINGHRYVLYANGEASIEQDAAEPAWSILLQCDFDTGNCRESSQGSPPQDAMQTARLMGQCFVAPGEVSVEAVPTPQSPSIAPPTEGWALTPTPEPEEAAEVETETDTPAPPPAACGLATVAEAASGRALQLLLVAAGADPGPIDGLPGRQTRDALAEVLGEDARGLEIPAALAALDARLCAAYD